MLVVVPETSAACDAGLEEAEDVATRELGMATLQRFGEPIRIELVEPLLQVVVGRDGSGRVAEVVAADPHVRVEHGCRDHELLAECVKSAGNESTSGLSDVHE